MHAMPGTSQPTDARRLRVLSMFSGMEAASVAASHLPWDFVAYAEIEPNACWALHSLYGCGAPLRMPRPEDASTPAEARMRAACIKAVSAMPQAAPGRPVNLGDISQVDWTRWRGAVDVVVGGPPCQAFSHAGNRLSLDDRRGNLSLEYVRAIHAIQPDWVFTENVPGWLSTKDNAFGCYLGALVGADTALPVPDGGRWGGAGLVDGPAYRAAWRVVDAQGFVPQRRRRVFVVAARSGGGGDPVRVLLETEAEARGHLGDRADSGPLFAVCQGVPGHSPKGREAPEITAGNAMEGSGGRRSQGLAALRAAFGGNNCSGPIDVATASNAHGGPNGRQDFESETFVVETVVDGAHPVGGSAIPVWLPEVAVTVRARDAKGSPDSDCTSTLLAFADRISPLAFHARQDPDGATIAPALDTDGYSIGVCAVDSAAGPLVGFQCQGTNVSADPSVMGTVRSGNQHVTGGAAMVAVPAPDPGDPRAVRVLLNAREVTETLAFSSKDYGNDASDIAPTLRAGPHDTSHPNSGVHVGVALSRALAQVGTDDEGGDVWLASVFVRRLTPGEHQALQGFPTGYLDAVRVKGRELQDGPRYKLCGNSWAVPAVRWVFDRLQAELGRQGVSGSQGGELT
jgi:DNA (cytosine-5)-methyltransferase 1